jgi:sodium/proline symporter
VETAARGIFDLYEIIPGFLISTLAILLFSLLEKKPSEEIMIEYHNVKNSN